MRQDSRLDKFLTRKEGGHTRLTQHKTDSTNVMTAILDINGERHVLPPHHHILCAHKHPSAQTDIVRHHLMQTWCHRKLDSRERELTASIFSHLPALPHGVESLDEMRVYIGRNIDR